ncbi:GTP-binding protein, partial [Streptomyces chartreusis]|uniref:GTP-binding protein n=1 Tax=Streptomyces chartreusis TaxID=1969 RepID=UPI0033F576E8
AAPTRSAAPAAGPSGRYPPHPRPGAPAPPDTRLTQLVLIGSGIDSDALAKDLEGCKSDAPHAADEHGMWGVLRYVQDPDGQDPDEQGTDEQGLDDPPA